MSQSSSSSSSLTRSDNVDTDLEISQPTTMGEIWEEDFEEDYGNPVSATVFSGSKKANYQTTTSTNISERFKTAKNFIRLLDDIPPEIIANANTKELFRDAPPCFKQMISMTMELGENSEADGFIKQHENGLPLREVPRTFRGFPRERLDSLIKEAFEILMNKNSYLFTTDEQLDKKWLRNKCNPLSNNATGCIEEACFHANIFPVDKTTFPEDGDHSIPLQRTIFDSRLANTFLQNPAPMELFTIEMLERVMSSNFQQHNKKVYTISADIRHFYHQLPLAKRYRKHYAINLGKGRILYPRAWPMGAAPAAGIGQAVTWSMLLAGLDKDCDKRRALGIDDSLRFDSIFPWLPLRGGGAIFVLIDNIFIVTTDPKTYGAWCRRIPEMAKKYSITLKQQKENVNDRCEDKTLSTVIFPSIMEGHNNNNNQAAINIIPTGSLKEAEFSGILFSRFGMRPKDVVDEDIQFENDEYFGRWKGTFRKLSGLIGQCLWVKRAQGTTMIQMPEFTTICPFIYPTSNQHWDDEIYFDMGSENAEIDTCVLNNLRKLYVDCRGADFGNNKLEFTISPYKTFREFGEIVRLATDASYSNEIAQHGWVWRWNDVPRSINNLVVRNHSKVGKSQIAIEELRAVVFAVEEILATAKSQHRKVDTFLLAIDSNHAKGMIIKGVAKTKQARELLIWLNEILDGRNIVFTYVQSKQNPADAPSRNELFNPELWLNLELSFDVLNYNLNSIPRTRKNINQMCEIITTVESGSRRERE